MSTTKKLKINDSKVAIKEQTATQPPGENDTAELARSIGQILEQEEKGEEKEKRPCCILTPNDSKDPSYTNLVLPYRVICRQRYERSGYKQRGQFRKEIRLDELLQTKALDGVRIHREFCNPILRWPRPDELIRLEQWQKEKLEYILLRPW